ncbi:MAG: sterol desaturase family protein [Myxococcota bacterium]|nr:sterol desaturase family protein [Myxococcota bacterium]
MIPLASKAAVVAVFVLLGAAEAVLGRFRSREQTTRDDVILDVGSNIVVPFLVLPAVLWCAHTLAATLIPGTQDMWAAWPAWLMWAVLFVGDDLSQYLWHRLSHTSWLYPLHRAHHSAGYMSVRIVYRNNLIYYAMMPSLWVSGVLVYWGLGPAYVLYLVAKMAVIVSAHSSVPWDAPLRRYRLTRPLIWVLERLISTPSTHAAHHGLHEADGVTHYRGNYGNFLFLWDVLFGTAHITGRRPSDFGIEGLEPVGWSRELLWPARAVHTDNDPVAHTNPPRVGGA